MDKHVYTALVILLAAAVTVFLRACPFLLFGRRQALPSYVAFLGNYLPPAIMAVLVVYCLRDIRFDGCLGGLPECVSVALVVAVHLWKNNALLSIGAGTVCFMILTRMVLAGG